MKKFFVSVIMPVYNCAKYISEAIESILNQTFKDFELIIINDGSIDESLEIIQSYANKDSRIRIINQPHSGIVKALNKGLKEAKGEWIFRMDADDIAYPHRFEVQIKLIEENPSLVLLGGWCEEMDENGRILKVCKYPNSHLHLVKNLINGEAFFPHPTAVFKKEAVLKVGLYREIFYPAEDIDLWLRLSEIGQVACIQDIILKLRKPKRKKAYIPILWERQLKSIAARVYWRRHRLGLSSFFRENKNEFTNFFEILKNEILSSGFWDYIKFRFFIAQIVKRKKFNYEDFTILLDMIKIPSFFRIIHFLLNYKRNFIEKLTRKVNI